MKNKYILFIVGILIGTILGYAYFYYIGCNSSSCDITSSSVNSMLYGSFLGGVLFFPNKLKEKKTD